MVLVPKLRIKLYIRNMDWKRCTEENYPDDNKMKNIIIAYRLDDVWTYQNYESCRYGWNVLCKMECYWTKLTPPEKNK